MRYIDDFGNSNLTGLDNIENPNKVTSIAHFGAVHQLTAKVCSPDGTTLEPAANGADGKSFGRGCARIPAGSTIKSAAIYINKKAKTPGASVKVGTYNDKGDAIDDDGLIAAGVVGTLDAVVGAGALIGKHVAADSFIKVVKGASESAGDFTGLDATLVIEYV